MYCYCHSCGQSLVSTNYGGCTKAGRAATSHQAAMLIQHHYCRTCWVDLCKRCDDDRDNFNRVVGFWLCVLAVIGAIALLLVVKRGDDTQAIDQRTTRAPLQAAPESKPVSGKIVLSSRGGPVIAGVRAWVEMDGKKIRDWSVGTDKVTLDNLPEGEYRVVVISVYEGRRSTIFNQRIRVENGASKLVWVPE